MSGARLSPDSAAATAPPRVAMPVWNSLAHDTRVLRAAATLAAAGTAVTVVAASWRPDEVGRTRHALGFDVITIARPRPWAVGGTSVGTLGLAARALRLLPAQAGFLWALWRQRPTVIHAQDLQALPAAWLVATLRCRPFVYDAHEINSDRTALRRVGRWIAVAEGVLARRAAATVATTATRAALMRRMLRLAQDPVVLPNRPWRVAPARNTRLRTALGIAPERVVVLYQGGLQAGRGLMRLVEQAPRHANAAFVFLGDGALRGALAARAAELGVADRVYFHAAVPWQELPDWTAGADVGVQLLEDTGLNHTSTDSNKLYEYAMAGLPVVASDFPEIRAVVAGHGTGLLVDPADDEAIAAALGRLIGDADLRARLGAAAVAARDALAWEAVAHRLLDLYRAQGWLPA